MGQERGCLTPCSALDLGSQSPRRIQPSWEPLCGLVQGLRKEGVSRGTVIEVTASASHLMLKLPNSLPLDILGTICLAISIVNSSGAAASFFCPSEHFVCGWCLLMGFLLT